jgi:hypothetical protein
MTRNHEYNTPTRGRQDWGALLNDNFERLDTDVEIRDTDANRGDYEPKAGAKYLATDTKRVYLGDGTDWQLFASFDGGGGGNVAFASDYEGATLDARVQAAIEDLPGGQGRVRVGPPADGTAWTWSSWTVDPTAHNGVHLDIDRNVEIVYPDDGVAITVDTAGKLPEQDSEGKKLYLTGGIWHLTGDPTGWLRGLDLYHAYIDPTHVDGLNNASEDCFGVQLRNAEYWCEDVHVAGKYIDCDVGLDLVPASLTGGSGTESFHDCEFSGSYSGVRGYGIKWRGDCFDVLCTATVILAGESARAHYLDGNFQDAVLLGSDSEVPAGAGPDQASFELGPNYFHGPLLLNHTDHAGVTGGESIDALFGIEIQGREFRIKNLNRPGTTFTMYRDGTVDFTRNNG